MRIAKKITLKALVTPTALAKRLQSGPTDDLRQIRFLKESPLVASMQLSERKAILWQPKTPLAILIEDQYLVELWRAMFEELWEKAK